MFNTVSSFAPPLRFAALTQEQVIDGAEAFLVVRKKNEELTVQEGTLAARKRNNVSFNFKTPVDGANSVYLGTVTDSLPLFLSKEEADTFVKSKG